MNKSTLIKVENLINLYDPRTTAGVGGASFELNKNECLGIIGPSGSGKSTLLKCIAGEIQEFQGTITQTEDTVIGYVAQNDLLDETLSIFDNLAKEIAHLNDEEKIANQVRSTLSLLEITNEIDNLPKDISGGQYQRVVIGKALVRNPNLLLLDEPFGHLDERLRFELMMELFPLFKSQGISLIWVTHQNHESLAFSDRIMILNYGKIQMLDTPYNITYKPKNLFSAQFLGHTNTVVAKLVEDNGEKLVVEIFGKKAEITRPENFEKPEYPEILLVIRASQAWPDEDGAFKGTIIQTLFLGETTLCEVEISQEQSIWMNVPGHQQVSKNQKINFEIDRERIFCLKEI
ncbi:MAG: ABC transporter ATP-binding protein [Bacteriovoracaceae bacterium]|nr:ABC transporter ATP-binding protein [Bacteriovoracaceae bacterium]